MLLENSDTNEVEFQLEKVEELVELVDDSSDGDSYISEDSNNSNDSITRNADFISLV
jgi:hypothetical protein